MKKLVVAVALGLLPQVAPAQVPKAATAAVPAGLLQAGPMVGYSEMREVMLWVQTTGPATAQIEYWEASQPATKWRTNAVRTTSAQAYTAHLLADQVQPGRRYAYALYLNGKRVPVAYPLAFQSQALWQWRTDPADFRLALGSCVYVNEPVYDRPGRAYGGEYSIFTAIGQQKPDFMLWLGDNTYLREADWNTRTGINHRYTHSRAVPELQPLLGSVHHYAIWDDHDYGPNDSDRSFAYKDLTLEAFRQFWANPNYGLGAADRWGGITGTFQWNDVQFFLLDDRWFRAPNGYKAAEADYLGQSQLQWLLDALTASQATFKIVAVGGQVLNPAKVFENYSNYEQERAQLLQALSDRNIPGVLFLSGDRHHTELTKLERPGRYPLYDFTASPLTSSVATGATTEANTGRVTGTLVLERNFSTIDVTGPLKERRLVLRTFSATGKQLWERTITAAELRSEGMK